VEYPGAIYHIIQRGNNREDVFENQEKKDYFISLLSKSVAVDGVELYAYVVMSNHYHLALRTCRETLSKVMHRLNSGYGIYYNRQMKRTGHVFQGRYKAIPVLDESYLMVLVKYIHLNPVRAGICNDLRDYPWSGDGCYRTTEPGIVETGFLLEMLSRDRKKSYAKYNLLMGQENEPDDPGIKKLITTENKNTKGRIEPQKVTSGRKSLNEIMIETGIKQKELEQIKKGSRLRVFTPVKAAYAKSAWENGYSLKEIACHIGVSSVAVFKYINKT